MTEGTNTLRFGRREKAYEGRSRRGEDEDQVIDDDDDEDEDEDDENEDEDETPLLRGNLTLKEPAMVVKLENML